MPPRLSSVPRIYMVEGKNLLAKSVHSNVVYACTLTHAGTGGTHIVDKQIMLIIEAYPLYQKIKSFLRRGGREGERERERVRE